MKKHIAPTRYYSRTVEMGRLEAFCRFLKYREWHWLRVEWTPVYKGQPGYEEAPFEEDFIEYPGIIKNPSDRLEEGYPIVIHSDLRAKRWGGGVTLKGLVDGIVFISDDSFQELKKLFPK